MSFCNSHKKEEGRGGYRKAFKKQVKKMSASASSWLTGPMLELTVLSLVDSITGPS